MEIGLVLARMVWNFEWELVADGKGCGFEEEKVYALWQKSGLVVRLRGEGGGVRV